MMEPRGSQCPYCHTVTGEHGFAMNSDGTYSEPELTFSEWQEVRVNALRELLKGIKIVST